MAKKWKFDDVDIERNPSAFDLRPVKRVSYKRAVGGDISRFVPPEKPVEINLELRWDAVREGFRDFLHDLYVSDKRFVVKSHLYETNPREKWTVKVDKFSSEYRRGGREQRFDIAMSLRVVDGVNDPTIIGRYTGNSHAMVVENVTNRDISNAYIFVRGIDRDVRGLRIKQTYKNLLENPGFELIDEGRTVGVWEDEQGKWKSDIVMFYEGDVCAKTYTNNAPLSQVVPCTSGEKLNVLWSAMSDIPGRTAKVTIECLNSDGLVITSYEDSRVTEEFWRTYCFITPETPAGTTSARVVLTADGGTQRAGDYIYFDAIQVQLGESEVQPEFSSHPHNTLYIPTTISSGDVLKIDLGTYEISVNDSQDNIVDVSGEFFNLPMGRSLLYIEDESPSGTTEVVVRFDEVWG